MLLLANLSFVGNSGIIAAIAGHLTVKKTFESKVYIVNSL